MKSLAILFFVLVAAVSAACPGSRAAGDHTITLNHDGDRRTYLLHVPAGIDQTKPIALVLAWHGLSHDPSGFAERTRFSEYSDSGKNFVVAYPEGVGASFNGGSCCPPAATLNVDDFGFARAIVTDVKNNMCIDANKVYTTGYSNGCFMSQGLICKAPDVFAASACGSGGIILETDCNKDFDTFNTSIRVLEIHGTADLTVPYNGNALLGFPPVPENYAANRARMQCANGPKVTFNQGRYYCEEYYNCKDGATVEQCTVTRGTHDWYDDSTFSNSEYVLDYFGLYTVKNKIVRN